MSHHLNEEEPLDPAAEQLHKKMRRLLLGSGLIMFVGFIAVFGAILYKTLGPSDSERAKTAIGTRLVENALPQGSTITGLSLNGTELAVSYTMKDGNHVILMIDRSTWQPIGKILLQSEAD